MKTALWYLGLVILISTVTFVVARFVGGWAAFFVAMVPLALVANGFMAECEDNQPGGFYNPLPPEKRTKPDDTSP